MNLPEISIKRHVFAYMLNGLLVLFGIIAYTKVGIDRFPYVEFPVVSVSTVQRGANPDTVDSSVTNVIETSVNSVPGIEHIQSSSSPGVSVIAITFNLDKRIDVAFNEVQAKVNQVLRRLPRDADPPIVAKVETNAQPIMWLALQGDRTQQQLNQYALNVIKKRLETVDGVGEVRLGGRRDRTIRVNLSPTRMAAVGVTTQDLTSAFTKEHLQLSGGFLVGPTTENLLKLDLEFHNIDELSGMIIAYRDGAAVRLKDVADIEDGLSDYRQLARFNGKTTIGLGIVKVANTNTVEIISRIRTKLDNEIIPQLPPGTIISIVSNDAVFINEMVNSLKEHLLEGTLLAALVVFLFLRSFRSTLIIAVAIPVSLLGAIAVIYASGYTLNSITLLALLLLVGVVVDDSIVVLENIFRHRETIDQNPISAALNGSREVVFAVLAATLSLVSIFAPVMFLGGIIGRFFQSFAVVVTFGVLVSLFVSVTLTPMLCSRYLKVDPHKGALNIGLGKFFAGMDNVYRFLLKKTLAHRWLVVFLTLIVMVCSSWFFMQVGKAFAPEQDEGRFLVNLKTPLGSSIDYTDSRLKLVEAALAKHQEIVTEFALIGLGQAGQVNQGLVVARMKPKNERTLKQQELIPIVRQEMTEIPGARVFVAPFSIVQGQRSEPLQFVLSGPNLQEVGRQAQLIQQKLSVEPGMGRIDMDLQLDLPQLVMNIDRTRAASLGLSSADIGAAVTMMTGGVDIGKYNDYPGDGERYDVRVKGLPNEFAGEDDLTKIFLRAKDSKLVRLDNLASFTQSLGPAVIGKFDLQYAATFFGSPSVPLGDAVTKVKMAAEQLSPGYTLKLTGQAEEFSKTIGYMIFAFVLALILLYMVLASQFNSFIQPFIIMLAQPLAIIGGVFALWATNQTLNIYSMIGLVLLIGLVAKNSILLVDLTNQRRAESLGVDAALNDACPTRMRPVLMTSATIILALFPAALGYGAGSETNQPLAIAVIGGMISSTLLTLVVVPAVYSLVENWRAKKSLSTAPAGKITV
ncbi:MAG: efflux RND transporter permease subunit [Burkholderiales bacterium]